MKADVKQQKTVTLSKQNSCFLPYIPSALAYIEDDFKNLINSLVSYI